MEDALITLNLNFNNEDFEIQVFDRVDKILGFFFYTFKFDENNFIIISKFDGKEWKNAGERFSNDLARELGKIIDEERGAPLNLNFDNKTYEIKVHEHIGKTDRFHYFTFGFNENNKIVISKFDGEEWKISAKILNADLASALGKIIDDINVRFDRSTGNFVVTRLVNL